MWIAIGASAVIHVAYALALQRGYRDGQFSVVYPVARGSGPVLTVLAAVLLWNEQPSLVGWLGILAVIVGIFFVAGGARLMSMLRTADVRLGLLWGLATGGLVAVYTLVDAWAVRALQLAPLLFYPLSLVLRSLVLAPFVLMRRAEAHGQWRESRGAIIGVGILSPAAYLLALLALQLAPLSYVAPAREVSMLVGAFVGARVFGETFGASRAVGVCLLLGGVVGISLA